MASPERLPASPAPTRSRAGERTRAAASAAAALLASMCAAQPAQARAPVAQRAPSNPIASSAASTHTLLQSRQLWATIDVCDPADQPDTVGIRGSMPGTGQAQEKMYMRFRLQYMDTSTKRWVDLSSADTGFVHVGSAKTVRQAGTSFELKPVAGRPAFALRGVVSFMWRKGSTVVVSVSRPTSTGRDSLAGADPAGFSAATCTLG